MSQEQSWRLILTEMVIDTRTPMGKAMAHMAVVFAELTSENAVVVPGANP
jgi:DNA invertase Pin-like site-specific DNA recombinase